MTFGSGGGPGCRIQAGMQVRAPASSPFPRREPLAPPPNRLKSALPEREKLAWNRPWGGFGAMRIQGLLLVSILAVAAGTAVAAPNWGPHRIAAFRVVHQCRREKRDAEPFSTSSRSETFSSRPATWAKCLLPPSALSGFVPPGSLNPTGAPTRLRQLSTCPAQSGT